MRDFDINMTTPKQIHGLAGSAGAQLLDDSRLDPDLLQEE
jgi:hypothetical protein